MPLPINLIPSAQKKDESEQLVAPANLPFHLWKVDRRRIVNLSAGMRQSCSCNSGCGGLEWPLKYSADKLEYGVDCTAWLQEGADTLGPISVYASPDGLSVGWPTIMRDPVTGRVYAVVYLGGGIAGEAYAVTFILKTTQARTKTETVRLSVNSHSAQSDSVNVPRLPDGTPVPPNAIRAPNCSILTLGPSVTRLVSTDNILTVDGQRHLTTPNGRALLDAKYQSHTDVLLIA